MIKYIGSKRRLVPVLGTIASLVRASTALDLFTGTTRVAQELRRRGMTVTAVDTARYAEAFARTYVALVLDETRRRELQTALDDLAATPKKAGYVTEQFCRQARYFQEANGERIDAMRDAIARDHAGTWREPALLTSLIEAADRVDSTTGVQMAYLKTWAPRASKPIELRMPDIPDGPAGVAVRADALDHVATAGPFDLAYLDPPYNQHRYFTNYHVWETIAAWDHPASYGVARKRVDAAVAVVSYNDEAWVSLDELVAMCAVRGKVEVLTFDSKRYVGAQIGIHDPSGNKVGKVGRLRNQEYVLVAGELTRGQRAALRSLAASTTAP